MPLRGLDHTHPGPVELRGQCWPQAGPAGVAFCALAPGPWFGNPHTGRGITEAGTLPQDPVSAVTSGLPSGEGLWYAYPASFFSTEENHLPGGDETLVALRPRLPIQDSTIGLPVELEEG